MLGSYIIYFSHANIIQSMLLIIPLSEGKFGLQDVGCVIILACDDG